MQGVLSKQNLVCSADFELLRAALERTEEQEHEVQTTYSLLCTYSITSKGQTSSFSPIVCLGIL